MPRKKQRRSTAAAARPGRRRRLFQIGLSLLGLGLLVYLIYLNYLVNERFEGDTWALPSRVYARPLELYPGLALTPA